MTMNALDLIDQELTRASAPKASRKPTFLFLKEGEKATIRPLYNLPEVLVMAKHNRWSESADQRVNAICAKEVGKSCWHCEHLGDDKKLGASNVFYLPVYVYSVVNTHSGQQVIYKDPDSQEEKPVQGIRVLELTSFGTISSVLKFFNSFYKDADNGYSITGNDFTIEQIGAGQKKSFVCMPKPAKPIPAQLQKFIPPVEQVKERIIAACPPLTGASETSNGHVQAPVTIEPDADTMAEF